MGLRSFGWDSLGRLKTVRRNGQELAGYGCDSQNRRVRKSVGAKTTYYLYDLESRLIAEIAGSGRVLREYVWLGQEPVALLEYELRPGLYYYINDHLGTPQRLITGEGTVVWQAAYLPFGRTQAQLGTVQNNLRFPGQYYDAETGLHYNWHRYYDPETGRYLSPDPIGLEGGLNLYAYMENDPVNWVDPWGLFSVFDLWPGHPEYEGSPLGCERFCKDRREYYGVYIPAPKGKVGDICKCKKCEDQYENPGHHDPSNSGPNQYNNKKCFT